MLTKIQIDLDENYNELDFIVYISAYIDVKYDNMNHYQIFKGINYDIGLLMVLKQSF